MLTFQIIEHEQAIVCRGGVFRQVDLYSWKGELFAKFGAGYIRLNEDGSTSQPKIRWIDLSVNGATAAGDFGRLKYLPHAETAKRIAAE